MFGNRKIFFLGTSDALDKALAHIKCKDASQRHSMSDAVKEVQKPRDSIYIIQVPQGC